MSEVNKSAAFAGKAVIIFTIPEWKMNTTR